MVTVISALSKFCVNVNLEEVRKFFGKEERR